MIKSGDTKGTDTRADDGEQPPQLAEYQYYVGYVPITAQLTPEMAEDLDATPVGGETPDPPTEPVEATRGRVFGTGSAETANRRAYAQRARTPRNKKADDGSAGDD